MTPQARVAAAIDVLDRILDGQPAEKTLTTWARKNRYAGSKDRAALRDLVYDALRQQRSSAHMGGDVTGRGLMIGQLRLQGRDPSEAFTGEGYAPAPLTEAESAFRPSLSQATEATQLDCQDWVLPLMRAALGDQTNEVLDLLRSRATVFLRTNTAKTTRDAAIKALAAEEVGAVPHPLSPTAIEVTQNARRVRHTQAFQTGLVELQDAASQAVVDTLCTKVPTGRVLDYCAGGGGKALAIAANGLGVTAHDADPARMNDLPERAGRAGTPIDIDPAPKGTFDAVLCDAPCSGSGAWRRQPEAKWRLTPDALENLCATQDSILDDARSFVRAGGVLAYATCSLFAEENTQRIEAFLQRNSDWKCLFERQFTPLDGADGFFVALMGRT